MYERIATQPNFSCNFLRGGSRFSPGLYILLTIGKIRGTPYKKVDYPPSLFHLIYQYLDTYTYPYLHISQYTDRTGHITLTPTPGSSRIMVLCFLISIYRGTTRNSTSTYSRIANINVGHEMFSTSLNRTYSLLLIVTGVHLLFRRGMRPSYPFRSMNHVTCCLFITMSDVI